jgi:phosphoadenosine phosphosulfate reductase
VEGAGHGDFEASEPSELDVAGLEDAIGGLDARAILRLAIEKLFAGRIALTSSFGADSAVLLHMLAQVARDTPVLFLDTGKLFPETIAYRDELVARLGLTDVRIVRPSGARLQDEDPSGYLWTVDPDRCCEVRKVEPLAKVLGDFDAWITGRKRFQGASRKALSVFEIADGKVKVNPLAKWQAHEIEAYLTRHGLPRHPLVAQGYASIGCATCTSPVKPGEDQRAGRWRHKGKTECGIHNRPQGPRIESTATTRELAG